MFKASNGAVIYFNKPLGVAKQFGVVVIFGGTMSVDSEIDSHRIHVWYI